MSRRTGDAIGQRTGRAGDDCPVAAAIGLVYQVQQNLFGTRNLAGVGKEQHCGSRGHQRARLFGKGGSVGSVRIAEQCHRVLAHSPQGRVHHLDAHHLAAERGRVGTATGDLGDEQRAAVRAVRFE